MRYFLIGLSLLLPSVHLFAQPGNETGKPFITNYTVEDYGAHAQNWTILQDKRGIMYFGNSIGLLEYDGKTWRLIRVTNRSIVRTLDMDQDGRVYVGGDGDFGFLDRDSLGQTQFFSLADSVPPEDRQFTGVATHVGDRGVYFGTPGSLFLWADEQIRVWKPKNSFTSGHYVNGTYFIHDSGTGLMQMDGDSLKLVPDGANMVNYRIRFMMPVSAWQHGGILIGTIANGLLVYDGTTFQPFQTKADGFLKSNFIQSATELSDGSIAISTARGGVAIIDVKGNFIQILDEAAGLQNNTVFGVYTDRNGKLWMAMNYGIAQADIPSPLTIHSKSGGLEGMLLNCIRHKETMYVGTFLNTFYMDTEGEYPRFKTVSGLTTSCWSFLSMNDHLLVATGSGVFEIDGDRATVVKASTNRSYSASWLYRSRQDPNLVLVGLFDGLGLLRFDPSENGNWIDEGRVSGIHEETRTIIEDDDGNFWLGTQNEGVVRVNFPVENGSLKLSEPVIQRFGTDHGLPHGGVAVFLVSGKVYHTMKDGVFYYDEASNAFIPDSTFDIVSFGGSAEEYNLREDVDGNVWVNFGAETALALRQPDGSYVPQLNPFVRLKGYYVIYPEPDRTVWFCTDGKLIRYDPGVQKDYKVDFPVLIRRVTAGEDLVIYGGATDMERDVDGIKSSEIKYNNNAMRFEFSALSYENPAANRFQWILEGFDKHWSAWSNESKRDYTNLPSGEYRFRVKAKNFYNHESAEAVYSFRILPPWWRTWWAYGGYALLLAGLVISVDRIQRRRIMFKEKERAQLREAEFRAKEAEAHSQAAEAKAQAFEAENERKKNTELLSEMGRDITASLDFNTIITRLYESINELTDATIFGVGLYRPEEQRIFYRFAMEAGKRYEPYYRETTDKNQFPVWCIENKKPVFINDVSKEQTDYIKQYSEIHWKLEDGSESKTPQSLIYVPLIVQDRVLGVITIQSYNKNAYDNHHLNVLTTIGSNVAVAIENARLFEDAKQRASELATVNRISEAITGQLKIEDLILMVGEKMQDLFKANIVYIALHDKKTHIIHFPYQVGDSVPSRPFGNGLTERIITSRKPILINQDFVGTQEQLNVSSTGVTAMSYLGVPIPIADEIIGVISIQSTEKESRFDERDQSLLTTIASNVGVAMHNAQLFQDAEKARQEAVQANEAKSSFLSTVSHELRTPLTSVLGFAKIIKKRLEEKIFPLVQTEDPKTARVIDQVEKNLDVVVSEGERLTTLINNVLDLAKIEAGKVEWNMEPLDIRNVVERAAASTSSLFENRPVSFNRQIKGKLPTCIGDEDKLIQVVINLISNAVKFTDEGSVTCRVEHKGEALILSIIDTGTGIAPGDQPKVFEKFTQVGDTLTDKPKGTGLGLPICKEIVKHHGGEIWVESEIGKGSTFSFSIPVTKTDRQKEVTQSIDYQTLVDQLKERVAAANLNNDGPHQTILVVDDEKHIRELLQQELGEAGYQVLEATNGREAVEKIRQNKPDLIILDVMMPEMDGFDVAAVLKNDPETMDIPIIILSIVQDKERGYRLGVDRYLTKPIDTDALFKEINILLTQRSSKKRVMVVDEDASTVRSLADLLQAKGYTVVESNGAEMIKKAIDEKPDMIIMNSVLSEHVKAVKSLRFEKGLENVFFILFQ